MEQVAGSTPILSNQLGTVYTEEQIQNLVDKYSIKYGVSSIKMMNTIKCESQYRNVQSNIIYKGNREDSWGIVQIHKPSHPEITREQALDPDFAVEYMAKEFSRGSAKQWSCYRHIYL